MKTPPDKDKLLRDFGRRLKVIRIEAGLTQEEAARRSGVGYKRWQKLEHGRANLTIHTLSKIAVALDTNVWELMTTLANTKGR